MSELDAGPDISVLRCLTRYVEGAEGGITGGQDQISIADLIDRFSLPEDFANRIIAVMEGDCKVVFDVDTACTGAEEAQNRGETFESTGGAMIRGVTFIIRGSVKAVVGDLDKMTIREQTGPCGTYPQNQVALFSEDGPQVDPIQPSPEAAVDEAAVINVSNLDGGNAVLRVYAEKGGAVVHTRTYSAAPLKQGQIGDFSVDSLTEVSVRYTDEGETLDNDAGSGFDAGADAGVADATTIAVIGHPEKRHTQETNCNVAGPFDPSGFVVLLVAGRVAQVISRKKR